MNNINSIEDLIFNKPFEMEQEEKEKILIEIFKEQLYNNRNNENIKAMYNKLGFDIKYLNRLEDIPYIPVNMFKTFDLFTCKEDEIVRILNSSATTTGTPSKIYIDKKTSIRQSQALIITLNDFLGSKRRPLLIMDSEDINKESFNLTARGAAVRGVSNFSNKIVYAMDKEGEDLKINFDRLHKFQEEHGHEEVLVYGFTYIIWSKFIKAIEKTNEKFSLPGAKIIHSGGWKKLNSKKVSKHEFSKSVSETFNTNINNVLDFYGMVEQLGVVFIDCECGYKHVPNFAEVIIRDIVTLEEVSIGGRGLIQAMSTLSSSYPAQAILTEDIGELVGIDDCKCGRKGKYFKFISRVEKTEIRGCGDTFAERENGND
ncbi:acyl-protein synthetase [uncultured Clostridium sp.]|uniref:LuxE/PaaK family acyltransferase n=1 Tax=uncultured Clostridium sp. TaxID=59620 RepID=UPI0028E932BF|nr:acyl-protein synthetase [uncultured Clostridium sp.]